MQLPLPALILLQRSIDAVIDRNPQAGDTLSAMDGSVVQIQIDVVNLSVYLIFVDQRIEIARAFDGKADVKLSGSPAALASMIRRNDALFKGEVSIEGDVGKSRLLKQLISSLDVDLEEELSVFVGDTVAHQVFRVHNQLSSFLDRTVERSQMDTRDYLQEEARLLPHTNELNRFNSDVDDLRASVDRFEARLKLLACKSKESS